MNPRPLHLFRRDLRLADNKSIHAAYMNGQPFSVGFIFDPRQTSNQNGYKSIFALRFLCESLTQLKEEIEQLGGTLNIWYGNPQTIIEELITKNIINAVHVSADYTPFSINRDETLADVCTKHAIPFTAHHDTLLTKPGTVLTGAQTPFKVFTPFYRAAKKHPVLKPCPAPRTGFAPELLLGASNTIPTQVSQQYQDLLPTPVTSGRAAGLAILQDIASHKNYLPERDILHLDATTHLSAHHKFGTISIRETYHALRTKLGANGEPLIRQLYWRDFFTHIAALFPHVFGHAFNNKYDHVRWENDQQKFERWCTGTTGFPLVDAGMRELNATGYMHNRARMVTASFLVKDLHIDWRWGERYFAQRLVDYDPCVNNGSWQWAASTGCDAQPYFRVFNPWLQQKRFDSHATYIKKWVPELSGIRATTLHQLDKKPLSIPNYPIPMVEHSVARIQAIEMFRGA